MEINKDFELIEKFFDLKLNDVELKNFEERITKDEVFAEKVRLYATSIDIIAKNDEDSQERKERWRAIISKTVAAHSGSSPKINLRWFIGIAASIVVALSIWQFGANVDHFDLEVALEEAWSQNVGLEMAVRSNSDDIDKEILWQAFNAYKNENYQSSLKLLNRYDRSFVGYHDVLILRALSEYQLDNTNQAFQVLDTLQTYNSAIAKWYKGLIHLSEGNLDKAKNFLIIPETNKEALKLK